MLVAFVCQTKADSDLMYKEVREKMKIPVNIELVENADVPTVREYPPSRMQKLEEEVRRRVHGISAVCLPFLTS